MHAQGAGSLHEKCRSLWAQWPDPPTPASSSPSRFSELNSSTLNATKPAEHAIERLLAEAQLGQLRVDDAYGRYLPQHCKRAALVIGRAVFKARAVKGRAAKVHMWLLRMQQASHIAGKQSCAVHERVRRLAVLQCRLHGGGYWSVHKQREHARGSPAPPAATQVLASEEPKWLLQGLPKASSLTSGQDFSAAVAGFQLKPPWVPRAGRWRWRVTDGSSAVAPRRPGCSLEVEQPNCNNL